MLKKMLHKFILFLSFLIPSLLFATSLPPAPEIKAKSFLVYDVQSDQILAAKGMDDKVEPASLTKLMTAYLVFKALDAGQLSLDQKLTVSQAAYKAEGSRMFLDPRRPASVEDVLKGLVVQSGNDAGITLAESLSGDERSFTVLMNQEATRLNMDNTHFENATGLPADNHYTTPKDLLILSLAIIQNHPQYFPLYSLKSFKYNKINQTNRNLLLFRDKTVDGLKTGYTKSAGYNLIATNLKDNRRLISIVIGADSEKSRVDESAKLLNWGRNMFVNRKVYDQLQSVATPRVYKGNMTKLIVGFLDDAYITIPVGSEDKVTTEIVLNKHIIAPVMRGEQVGNLLVKIDGETYQSKPIVALQEVKRGGFFRRLWDSIVLFFSF